VPYHVRHAEWVPINGGMSSSWRKTNRAGRELRPWPNRSTWTSHKFTENWTSYRIRMPALWCM